MKFFIAGRHGAHFPEPSDTDAQLPPSCLLFVRPQRENNVIKVGFRMLLVGGSIEKSMKKAKRRRESQVALTTDDVMANPDTRDFSLKVKPMRTWISLSSFSFRNKTHAKVKIPLLSHRLSFPFGQRSGPSTFDGSNVLPSGRWPYPLVQSWPAHLRTEAPVHLSLLLLFTLSKEEGHGPSLQGNPRGGNPAGELWSSFCQQKPSSFSYCVEANSISLS